MRIRIIQRPHPSCIDGLQLERFEPGFQYEVGTSLGCLLLAEGWAEPVISEEPALLVPLRETNPEAEALPPNLTIERRPSYAEPRQSADDSRRTRRRRMGPRRKFKR